ncbi:MAG: VCBS repeat-containing protein [Planctomycetaceae bacterium]
MTRLSILLLALISAAITQASELQTGNMSSGRVHSKLFRHQYTIYDHEFCGSEVCVDFDNDGHRELLYASRVPGKLQLLNAADGSVRGSRALRGQQQSTSAFDLDGDGSVEIVGMTFGGEVYCLDAKGSVRWRRDLRPELDDSQHMYLTPILCDLNGDRQLEILAMTHGQYSPEPGIQPNARLTALNAAGQVLDELDLGESRYWGHAYVCNVDDDPQLELVVSGYGGLDVIETRGFGSNTEHFQRRRSYQRLNVRPWVYEDSYFIERGRKKMLST